MWVLHKKKLAEKVEKNFIIIKENFKPKLVSGYDNWRLDNKKEWLNSMYLSFENDNYYNLNFEKFIKDLLVDVRIIALDFLKKSSSFKKIQNIHQSQVFITKYSSSEGVKEHCDDTLISVLIGLNSEFSGGNLKIIDKNFEHFIRYETGDVVVMEGDVRHMGQAVTSGERWMMAVFYNLF